jgi:hypothetical protein
MITLDNGHIALTLDPDFGARITSLMDLSSGRQWLVPGTCVGGDTYLGEQARGWDECFPTIAPCDDATWGPLRDHGELWGRVWHHDGATSVYIDPRFTFARNLHLQGATLTAAYHITNKTAQPLPYLWSQHCLLATTPADRITIDATGRWQADSTAFDWPHHPARDLSIVDTTDAGFAQKSYGEARSAAIIGPDGGIRFDWSGAFGLWLDYGGWPTGNPMHQVALEPTTAPADDLASATRMGRAATLPPQSSHYWTVRISLTPRLQ